MMRHKMFCRKCGKELQEGAKFCPGCGSSTERTNGEAEGADSVLVDNEADKPVLVKEDIKENIENDNDGSGGNWSEQEETVAIKKKKNLMPIVIGGIAVVFIIGLIITGTLVLSSPQRKYEKQLSLGQKYMDELDYEQAVAAYKAAIEIDAKNPEAYKALAELYIEMGEPELAMDILEVGIRETDSEELKAMLKKLDEQVTAWEPSEVSEGEPDPDVSDDPYVRLDAGEYDEVLELYLKMLEDDPGNPEIYLVIVEAYLRKGDYDKAREYAELGYEKTGDERLKEKIDMIESGNISDSVGRALKMTWVEDGEVVWWHEYTYSDKGRKKSTTVFDSGGNQVDYGEYEYDDENRVLVSVGGYSCSDGMLIRYLYYYDENGRTIRNESGPNSNFRIERVVEYLYHGDELEAYRENVTHYDKDGNESMRQYELHTDNKTEVYRVESDGSEWLETVHEWEYDDNGNVLRYIYSGYDRSGNVIHQDITVYEYDEDGKMTRDVTYDTEGNILDERNYQ